MDQNAYNTGIIFEMICLRHRKGEINYMYSIGHNATAAFPTKLETLLPRIKLHIQWEWLSFNPNFFTPFLQILMRNEHQPFSGYLE